MADHELIIVGGANGTGKTTFAMEYVEKHNRLYLGADAIAMELSPLAPHTIPITAGKVLSKRLSKAIENRQTIVLESTLSGKTLCSTIKKAKATGYQISLIFLFLDSMETCIARIQERVLKGGHAVPEPDIRRRFPRSINNFWKLYRQLADHWLVVYNAGTQPIDVATGHGNKLSIRDQELFDLFSDLQKT